MRSSVVLVALVLAACNPKVCTRNSDCGKGLVCGGDNTCVIPPDMTVLPDGGTTDLSAASDLGEQEDLALDDAADHD